MKALIAAILLFVSIAANAQTERDVVDAFDKLAARVEVGVNFRDFSAALGEVNYQLKRARDAKPTPKLSVLQDAFSNLVVMRDLWQYETNDNSFTATIDRSSPPGRDMLTRYPEADKPIAEGGALMPNPQAIEVRALRAIAWRKAASLIDKAKAVR